MAVTVRVEPGVELDSQETGRGVRGRFEARLLSQVAAGGTERGGDGVKTRVSRIGSRSLPIKGEEGQQPPSFYMQKRDRPRVPRLLKPRCAKPRSLHSFTLSTDISGRLLRSTQCARDLQNSFGQAPALLGPVDRVAEGS